MNEREKALQIRSCHFTTYTFRREYCGHAIPILHFTINCCCKNKFLKSTLLYLSISMCGVIGQFSGQYFTARPASFHSRAPDQPQRYNKCLTYLVFSVRSVSYGPRFFPLMYGPRPSRLGHTSTGKILVRNLQYGPRTRWVRGLSHLHTNTVFLQ